MNYVVLFSLQLGFLLEESRWEISLHERMRSLYLIRPLKDSKGNEKKEKITAERHVDLLATFHLILYYKVK